MYIYQFACILHKIDVNVVNNIFILTMPRRKKVRLERLFHFITCCDLYAKYFADIGTASSYPI